MIYIASPYSHPDKEVREERVRLVAEYTANLVKQGNIVFSPIVYGHELCKYQDLPGDFEFWGNFCLAFLDKCTEMYVLCLDGWEQSKGIKEEIKFCNKHEIPIYYILL